LSSPDSLLQERLTGVEKASEELSQQHRKEVSRLEAALAGAEAAKKQLSTQQAQHSTAGEFDVQTATAAQAEADARASSLQRQIDTHRAQAAASRSGLQDEANSLKVTESQVLRIITKHCMLFTSAVTCIQSCGINVALPVRLLPWT